MYERQVLYSLQEVPSPKNWYAVRTRTHQEKFVEQWLQNKCHESFLPLRKIIKKWSDRKKIVQEPLFRGYLFVRCLPHETWNVSQHSAVLYLLGTEKQNQLPIPAADILALQRFVESSIAIDPYPYLRAGQRIRVRNGIFKGIEGFIVKKKRECRLVFTVEMMQQSVSVEVDEASVEAI